jgi:hypothetical protein
MAADGGRRALSGRAVAALPPRGDDLLACQGHVDIADIER